MPKKADPAATIRKTLDKTERDIKRAGVSGDPVLDGLKEIFAKAIKDR